MAEPVKSSGAPVSAVPTAPNSTMNVNGTSGQPRSLFDAIDPSTANTANANGNAAANGKSDKNKTTDMKTEGVKPLTALGPILGILGVVIGLVLWNTNHTAAIIVGLIGLAILVLWFIARRSRKAAEANKGKKKPGGRPSSNPHSSTSYQRRPFGWLRRRGRQSHGSHNGAHGGSNGSGSHTSSPWWRRGRHNPLNRDRRRSRDGSETDAHGRSRNGRSNHTGDNDSRRRRRSWWPGGRNRDRSSRNPRDSHSDGPGHRSRSRNTHGSKSGRRFWPFGGGRPRHHSNSSGGGTPHGSGSPSGNGSHGGSHSGSSGGNRGRRWYKPWTWRNRNHGGSRDGGNGNPNGPDGHVNPSADNRGDTRRGRVKNGFRKLWQWQLYDSNEESVNGDHDPNRRNRFRDRWNARRTHKQRENVNYAGFAIGADGQARPHYSRWHDWRSQARARNWFTFGPESPNRATATRMDQTPTPDQTSPAIGGHSLSLGSGNGIPTSSFTQSTASATVPVASNGGSKMNDSSGSVIGAAEAQAYDSSANSVYRSAVEHIMIRDRARARAQHMAQSNNPWYRAAAAVLMNISNRAHSAAEVDARNAAQLRADSQNAIGNGQRSIES